MKSSVTPYRNVEVREVALDGVAEVFRDSPLLVDEFAGLFEGIHELGVGEVVGVVESQRVRERDVLVLRVDELDDVRVGDAHDTHLRAAACAALGDGLAHLVVGPHERDRAGGDAARATDGVAVRPELPERVAHPAARLEDLGGLLRGLVDVVDVVARRVDEAGRELLEFVARVHQRRRVRHEGEVFHRVLERFGSVLDVRSNVLREFGNDGVVGELVDVVGRERRLGVRVGGRALAEHLAGEFVATRVARLQLVGRHRDIDVALVGLEDRLRERDVLRDALEEFLLGLDEFPVGVLAEVARRQDVVVGVRGETVFERLAVDALHRQADLVGGVRAAHASVLQPGTACFWAIRRLK